MTKADTNKSLGLVGLMGEWGSTMKSIEFQSKNMKQGKEKNCKHKNMYKL